MRRSPCNTCTFARLLWRALCFVCNGSRNIAIVAALLRVISEYVYIAAPYTNSICNVCLSVKDKPLRGGTSLTDMQTCIKYFAIRGAAKHIDKYYQLLYNKKVGINITQRSKTMSYKGKEQYRKNDCRFQWRCSANERQQLKRLAAENNVTMNTLLSAAWAHYFYLTEYKKERKK